MIELRAPMCAVNRAAPRIRSARRGRYLLGVVALATLLFSSLAGPVAATTAPTASAEVIAAARSHLGAPYVYATDGPRTFDCSGLVFRSFKEAGEVAVIGWTRKSAFGYMRYFERRGLASRRYGRPGDLVVYGGGSHIGIYLGDAMVISALTSGVRRHGLRRLNVPFTEFLHTHLNRTY